MSRFPELFEEAIDELVIGEMLLVERLAEHIARHIVERQDALQRVSRYNTAWLVGQAVSELARLKERVASHAVGDSAVDREEVQLGAAYAVLDLLRRIAGNLPER